MSRKKEEEVEIPPVTNLKGHPIHYDENTTENWMRKVSVRDMMELAKKPDTEGRLLLHEELDRAKPNEDIIEVLLQVEPERIKKKKPVSGLLPIHVACQSIHSISSDVLMTLLEAWPDSIKQQCNFGFLPLHKALMANMIGNQPPNIDNITMIVEAYPEGVGIQNNRGQYPLHCCIENRRPNSELVDLLIDLSGKWICDVEDKMGHTPLHKAVSRKKDPEISSIVETLVEKAPQCCKHPDKLGMLPIHWAVSRQEPVLEVLIELMEAFPLAIFHKDNSGKMPYDRVLAYGSWRCGSTMSYLNNFYEGFLDKRKLIKKMWEEDFIKNAPHLSKLKAPNQAPRVAPYTFGTHDWCLSELTHTERQMALIIFRYRVTKKLLSTELEMRVFLILLRHEFVKRGGKVECFGPPLNETNGDGGPISGPHAKWWLAKIYLPDWDPNGNNKVKSLKNSLLLKASKSVVLATKSIAAITTTTSDATAAVPAPTKEEEEDDYN